MKLFHFALCWGGAVALIIVLGGERNEAQQSVHTLFWSPLAGAKILQEPLSPTKERPILFGQLQKQLEESHLFAQLHYEWLAAQRLAITYELATPIAYLDGENKLLCDRQGNLFAQFPYFSPKRLPLLHGFTLQEGKLVEQEIEIITQIIQLFEAEPRLAPLEITTIDLAFATRKVRGQRKLSLELKERRTSRYFCFIFDPHELLLEIQRCGQIYEQLLESKENQWSSHPLHIDLRFQRWALAQPSLHNFVP